MPGFEWIGEEEKEAVNSIFDNGGVLIAHGFHDLRRGVYHVREFEDRSAEYFGVKHCLAVSSGTAAVKIALKAAGVLPGDEVITQAFNFIAVVEAILDVGAVPIIANVDHTLNMNPENTESLVSKRTRALLPIHMLGVSADMMAFKEMAKKYDLALIEDSCEAVGGRYRDHFLGKWGDVAAFSFDQGKMIATGEGGMVLTDDDSIAKYAREYHDHGHENSPKLARGCDSKNMPGFNYRMTEMQAAVGKAQLRKLDAMLMANRARYRALEQSLGGRYQLRSIPEPCVTTFDTFIIISLDESIRHKMVALLANDGFGTKNLPDAMEWHCAAFWDHALKPDQVEQSMKTRKLLEQTVAIPIWLKKSPKEYEGLGRALRRL